MRRGAHVGDGICLPRAQRPHGPARRLMHDRLVRAAAEFVGTFFLVFIGVGSIMVDSRTGALGHLGVSLAFGFVILTMIYAVGHISGAHFNPAVTVGFASVRRFPWREVPGYLTAQLLGATLAAVTLRILLGATPEMGVTVPAVDPIKALGIEALLTFVLMFVIIAVATDVRAGVGVGGLAIGLTVAMDALMGGPLTGGSMNPARTLGPAVVAGEWTHHWLYWIGPSLGSLAAARTYELLRTGSIETVVPPSTP